MDYLLFTYPNCQKCETLKSYLRGAGVPAEVLDVAEKPGRLRIREFLPRVKRDEKGAVVLPTLVLHEAGRVAAVVNSREELEAWSRSRA